MHFAAVGNGRLTTNGQYTAVTHHPLNAASDMFSCVADMFLNFFQKRQLLSVSFRKLITKVKTCIIVDFMFRDFINRSNRRQHML